MNAGAFRVWILRFLRIRFRWFFVGSGSVGFLRIGIRLVFQDRDSVGFLRIGIRLVFLGSDLVGFSLDQDSVFL
jgi:hypothetical protein